MLRPGNLGSTYLQNALVRSESRDAGPNAVLDAPHGALVALDGGLLLRGEYVPEAGKALSCGVIAALVEEVAVVVVPSWTHADVEGSPTPFEKHWRGSGGVEVLLEE